MTGSVLFKMDPILFICPGYDGKLDLFTKAQFSTIEVLVGNADDSMGV